MRFSHNQMSLGAGPLRKKQTLRDTLPHIAHPCGHSWYCQVWSLADQQDHKVLGARMKGSGSRSCSYLFSWLRVRTQAGTCTLWRWISGCTDVVSERPLASSSVGSALGRRSAGKRQCPPDQEGEEHFWAPTHQPSEEIFKLVSKGAVENVQG